MLIQCFLYYSPFREKSIHMFLELFVVISLQQVYQFMGHDISFMSKNITQDMAYRQSLMKYAEKYGVSRASRK